MLLEIIKLGFSTADTGYPELVSSAGMLSVRFTSSDGKLVLVHFQGVAAFSWQENNDLLLDGEPADASCEIFNSSLLELHTPGITLNSSPGLRHIRLNFNAWGRLDVLCTSFQQAA